MGWLPPSPAGQYCPDYVPEGDSLAIRISAHRLNSDNVGVEVVGARGPWAGWADLGGGQESGCRHLDAGHLGRWQSLCSPLPDFKEVRTHNIQKCPQKGFLLTLLPLLPCAASQGLTKFCLWLGSASLGNNWPKHMKPCHPASIPAMCFFEILFETWILPHKPEPV
jgi:hypothetical protein